MKRLLATAVALLVMIMPLTAYGACAHKQVSVSYIKASAIKDGTKKTVCGSCGKTVKTVAVPRIGDVKVGNVTYNGKYRKPAVKVYDRKGNLISSANYTVSYGKAKSVGKHSISVAFRGKKYKGTAKAFYIIRPCNVKWIEGDCDKATDEKKDGVINFEWGEASGSDGYMIRVARTSDFEEYKTAVVSSGKSYDFEKLVPGKNYYYKIRTFKTVKGVKYYSRWSEVEKTQASGKSNPASADTVLNASVNLFGSFMENKQDENVLISPISLIMSLGMVENGADNKTLDRMEETLGFDGEEIAMWTEDFMNGSGDELCFANGVWYRNGKDLEMNEEYLENIRTFFRGEVRGSDFNEATVDEINNWCDKNTDGNIKKLLDKFNKDTRILIANATCFKGEWEEKYTDKNGGIIENEKFKESNGSEDNVTMLHKTERTVYYSDEDACGFKKFYKKDSKGNGYYFLAILPDEGIDANDYAAAMDGESFKNFLANSKKAELETKIPEFKYDYNEKNAVEILKDMGMEDLFDEKLADLTKMGKSDTNLYVSDVIHKTHIQLDRNGTTAAAATGITIDKATSVPEQLEHKQIFLNRPFVYAICDSKTDIPVFIGVVNKVK